MVRKNSNEGTATTKEDFCVTDDPLYEVYSYDDATVSKETLDRLRRFFNGVSL